jgi:hypothetical protein
MACARLSHCSAWQGLGIVRNPSLRVIHSYRVLWARFCDLALDQRVHLRVRIPCGDGPISTRTWGLPASQLPGCTPHARFYGLIWESDSNLATFSPSLLRAGDRIGSILSQHVRWTSLSVPSRGHSLTKGGDVRKDGSAPDLTLRDVKVIHHFVTHQRDTAQGCRAATRGPQSQAG